MLNVTIAIAASAAFGAAVMWPLHHFVLGPHYARRQAAIDGLYGAVDNYLGNLPLFVTEFNAISAAYEATEREEPEEGQS